MKINKEIKIPVVPLIISALLLIVCAVYYYAICSANSVFIYCLDDAYIHLALAKHWAERGVFGITQYGFTNASSAPIWSFLLGIFYRIFGRSELYPLLLQLLFSICSIFAAYSFLRRRNVNSYIAFITLLLLIFSAPFPLLIFMGMEHSLQILVTILLLLISLDILAIDDNAPNLASTPLDDINEKRANKITKFATLLILCAVTTLIRYESLFLIFVLALLFLGKRQYYRSLFVICAGAVPIIFFGIFSLSQGWYFLPNSLMMKVGTPALAKLFAMFGASGAALGSMAMITGNIGVIGSLFDRFWNIAIICPSFVLLLIAPAVFLFNGIIKRESIYKDVNLFSIIFLSSALLHIFISRISGVFRYEAYLICLGVLLNAIIFSKALISRKESKISKTILIFICLSIIALIQRGYASSCVILQSSHNIYEQQYQMARFTKDYYNESPIAINDIGCIGYFSDAKIVDLWGLASKEVAKARIYQTFDATMCNKLIDNSQAKIAIVYEEIFTPDCEFYKDWIKAATWEIQDNYACTSENVSFFAKDSSELISLKSNLMKFEINLPKTVKVNY